MLVSNPLSYWEVVNEFQGCHKKATEGQNGCLTSQNLKKLTFKNTLSQKNFNDNRGWDSTAHSKLK
jgi:hypothetical protein